MPHQPAAITVRGLRKSYGSKEVLHGLDFTVERGTIFGMIGPNGAGKTTTMRALLDIIRPSSGELALLGEDPRRGGPALRRRIGYLPGDLILQARTTGRRLVEHYGELSGPVRPGRVRELAERLDLDLDVQIRRLSKGNKQKLGLVQAFMHDPELLVLDEPTSGLDPLMQAEFLALLHEARAKGQTVFLSSHVLSEIQAVADEVAILREGKITTIATVEELRATATRRLRLVAGNTSPEKLAALLQGVPGVARLAVHSVGAAGMVEATGVLEDGVSALVRALAAVELHDLVLEEPDLEEAVLSLYSEEVRP
ncbi:ABC transporter ATP-binding protein [Arthrobacter sp. 35W]|uniref:ABC transporter ATP-binding protein n=1 Tax=Arthrobacter sp. 35W TaxID=1132441 RepID=UPI00040D2CB5|nr:ABC transporter ATP-binding protein [Arthrobacter sp. 35W]